MEVANSTSDVFVPFDGEGYYRLKREQLACGRSVIRNDGTYNPTECEPRVTLDNVRSHISAMVTLADDVFISGHLFSEGVLSAHEKEEHYEESSSAIVMRLIGSRREGGKSEVAALCVREVVLCW